MAVKYGKFPRGLAIGSGVFAIYLAGAALISAPLGFVGSAIILFLWGCFLKLIAFGYEPQHFRIIEEEPKKEKPPLQKLDPEEFPDWSEIVASIQSVPDSAEGPDRILPESNRGQVAQSRVIGQDPHQDSREVDSEAEERREDKEWANMLRAL